MARVFILGAGASHFAAYPLGLELWPFIRDTGSGVFHAERRRREAVKQMEQILSVNPPLEYDQPNLQELFTLLDLGHKQVGPLGLERTDWPVLRRNLIGMIVDAFLMHEHNFQHKMTAHERSIRTAWADSTSKGDTIISFNWDILHESALWDAKKWHFSDGYGFRSHNSPKVESPVKILKLHGSVNWAQRNETDCEPAIEHKSEFFRGAPDSREDYLKAAPGENENRFLITPTYMKDISLNKLLLTLWKRALDALANAGEVTVVGFSLNPADALARQLLGLALTSNQSLRNVFVVGPEGRGPDHWDQFCTAIGKVRKPVRMTFEQWIMAGAK